MNKSLSILAFLLSCLAPFTHALELPIEQTFEIKNIKDLNVLYVHYDQSKGHISNTVIKLVQYYLLKDDGSFEVIFPQLSVEGSNIDGSYYAIGYKGNPKETETVKKTTFKGGLFASYIYKGSYKTVGKAIRKTFHKVLETGKFVPHDKEEIRLLYWNSIDDNYPKYLITEIQVVYESYPE